MNDRQLMNIIKDVVQQNVEDPRFQYEGVERPFVHTDRPLSTAKYPRIQITKDPTTEDIISMGYDFWEHKEAVLNIYFWTTTDFKWTADDGSILKNEELAKEYNDKIWKAIKAQGKNLHDDYGITGFKLLLDDAPDPDTTMQTYNSLIKVRFWYFVKGCN